jgi:ABC-type nitrate/sulfonate/bicarbonate transport system substrate-binding protein
VSGTGQGRFSRLSFRRALSHAPRRVVAPLAALTITMTVLATAPSGASAATLKPLTLAIITNDAQFSPPILADYLGLYKKAGVSVKVIPDTGASTINSLLTSGQADIIEYNGGNDIILASKGVKVKIIAGTLDLQIASIIGSSKVKTLSDAEHLSSCKMATLTPGSSVYGSAIYLNKRLDLHCSISSFSSVALVVAAVQSGNYQLGVMVEDDAISAVQSKSANMVLNSNSPTARRYSPAATLNSTFTGLDSDLTAKKASVVAFLKATLAANTMIHKDPPQQIAQELTKTSAFAGVKEATIISELEQALPYIPAGENAFNVSEPFWDASLNSYASWGIPGFSKTDSAFSYSSMVDMSYNKAAVSGS